MNATAVSPDKLHSSRESELALSLTVSQWNYIIYNIKWVLADGDCGWFNGRTTLGSTVLYKSGIKWPVSTNAEIRPLALMYLQWDCPSNDSLWESVMRNTFFFFLGLAIPARAAVMLGWTQIQLDLTNVQKLWFFQATLCSFTDGKSQMRLNHDHRVLPPA